MNTNIKYLMLTALASLALFSCHDKAEKEGGDLISQNATFYSIDNGVNTRANFFKTNAIELEEAAMDNVEKSFKVEFAKPLSQDTKLSFVLSSEGVAQYNKLNATDYEALPADLITLPETIMIKKGQTATPEFLLSVKITEAIKLNKPYVFVLELQDMSASGVKLFRENSRVVYTLIRNEESTELNKSVQLKRDVYLSSKKLDNNLHDVYNSSSFTVETLLNVQKFRNDDDPGEAFISTLFGVEGKTLFRFGDNGVPGNVLQAAGNKIDEQVFATNKWYHLAISFDNASRVMRVYVNGRLIRKQANVNASLDTKPWEGNRGWYIGRSWNEKRGIYARFAEMRIWTAVRSGEEIANNMYQVDPKSPNLLAYWQMNKLKGTSEVVDATGNGYDLTLRTQKERTPKDVTIVDEAEPISVE